ncbi:MAG: hypothetical protein ACC655_05325 [Rhodothermia bacterium]
MSQNYCFDPTDLDEFLVEYVDGTMDPVVRGAFEEFMRVYPEVRAHVDCLTSIRTELCKLGDDCRCLAPPGFQDRLKRQLACEMSGAVALEDWTPQLNMIALAFSITLLMLAVGLSRVGADEALADEEFSGPATVLVESPSVALEDWVVEDEPGWTISRTHRLSMASSFSATFERPMLMSVRRDFIAMKPVSMSLAP